MASTLKKHVRFLRKRKKIKCLSWTVPFFLFLLLLSLPPNSPQIKVNTTSETGVGARKEGREKEAEEEERATAYRPPRLGPVQPNRAAASEGCVASCLVRDGVSPIRDMQFRQNGKRGLEREEGAEEGEIRRPSSSSKGGGREGGGYPFFPLLCFSLFLPQLMGILMKTGCSRNKHIFFILLRPPRVERGTPRSLTQPSSSLLFLSGFVCFPRHLLNS